MRINNIVWCMHNVYIIHANTNADDNDDNNAY